MKLANVLSASSGLILNRFQVRSLNDRIVKKTGYYKPILPDNDDPALRIDELPLDMQDEARDKSVPKPKHPLFPP